MSLNKYKTFILVVELGSLTRAAEATGITQSAVSHIINSMEREFGFSLLRRGKSGAALTADGERVLPAIRDIVNGSRRLDQIVTAIRGADSGIVRIGTFTSVAVHWLPGMIKAFQRDYPNVELKLMSGDYHDVEQWLEEGSADIGFVALPSRPAFTVSPLVEDRLLAIVPKDHRLAALPNFPLEEVADEPFISLLESSNQDVRRALESVGVRPKIRFTTKDDYAIIAMVEQGLGMSIMPELLLRGRTGNVCAMALQPAASRIIGLAIPDPDKAGPATLRFSDYVTAWVKKEYGQGPSGGA
ncbi:MAG TPA: LysR family transcriptional regulator [Clostridiales bacterium]|jgi:DNA-binding transcriptional LysR family regulator|nr:LysR family transcriptional regulator [Clostridiales bacterium]